MNGGLIHDETGMQRTLGYVLDVGNADKRARCWLEIDDRHLNRHGVLHGGLATVLLDSAAGATASLSRDPQGRLPFLTISFNTQFLAPAGPGRVIATGRVVGGGRSLLFVEADLEHEDATLVARGAGVFKPAAREAGQ